MSNSIPQDYAERRRTLVSYLVMKVNEEDWHGVADAAMDIRDLDSEVKGYKRGIDEQHNRT